MAKLLKTKQNWSICSSLKKCKHKDIYKQQNDWKDCHAISDFKKAGKLDSCQTK